MLFVGIQYYLLRYDIFSARYNIILWDTILSGEMQYDLV